MFPWLHILKKLLLSIAVAVISNAAMARGVYQEPSDFVNEVFANTPPKAQVVWITKDLQDAIAQILGHKPNTLRVRYWRKNERSCWILDEIGKEQPITTGIVINESKIELVRVLVFRESRGWEVRHGFFTDQFIGAHLTQQDHLSHNIDGITGATLSVRAVTKLARVALLLHKQTKDSNVAP